MSFKKFEDLTLGISQGLVGEEATLKQGSSQKKIKAIFDAEWIEVEGVSTFKQIARIKEADIFQPFARGHQLIRGTKTYNVSVSQQDGPGALLLILTE